MRLLTSHSNNDCFVEEVEEMLRMTGKTADLPQSAVAAENPQVMRVRQHFEKKNKKYTQEREQLAVRFFALIPALSYCFSSAKSMSYNKEDKSLSIKRRMATCPAAVC